MHRFIATASVIREIKKAFSDANDGEQQQVKHSQHDREPMLIDLR